jgi:isopenicillin N synthase-like dioxygenase
MKSSAEAWSGYQRLKENVTNGKADNHEGIDFYKPVEKPERGRALWGENQWPSDDDVGGFRQKYEIWIEKMKVLGMCVMEAYVHSFSGHSTILMVSTIPAWLLDWE